MSVPLFYCMSSLLWFFFCLESEAQSIVSKEKDPVCDGDTGFHNVELWSTEVSCLGIPLCIATLLSCDFFFGIFNTGSVVF